MRSQLIGHVVKRIGDTSVESKPFAHLFVENVFPPDIYDQILEHLPDLDAFVEFAKTGRVGTGYNRNRMFLSSANSYMQRLPAHQRLFWQDLFATMDSEALLRALLDKFMDHIQARFDDPALRLAPGDFDIGTRLSLVRDLEGFDLGPHTDGLKKVLSGLFYLAADDTAPSLGTCLYVPKDPNFECSGGPHHPFDRFHRVKTMPYKANSFFIFPKTKNCFHGVEKVPDNTLSRDIIFLDIIGLPIA